MTNFNQISKKYYRKAKHEMPLCYAEKKLYLAELSETLHAIETEHPYHEEGAQRHHCRCGYDLLCSWLCAGYMISSKLIKSRYTAVIHEPVVVESRAIQE